MSRVGGGPALREFEERAKLCSRKPAFCNFLPAAYQSIFEGNYGLFATSHRKVLDPAVALVGYTLAQVLQPRRVIRPAFTVTTWVLFCDQHKDLGRVARLTLERIPGGCGVLFPDPTKMGYFWAPQDDTTFQAGLLGAWYAAMQNNLTPDYDLRWSLQLMPVDPDHPTSSLPVRLELTGPTDPAK